MTLARTTGLWILPCAAMLLAATGGCSPAVQTDSAVFFLRMQLLQSPPGGGENGWSADYDGLREGYHYMKVEYSNYMQPRAIWEGSWRQEIHRCPAAALPEGYPQDLARQLAAQRPPYWDSRLKPITYLQSPPIETANKAIRQYLQEHGKLTAELDRELRTKPE